jgi:hypothetical protein
MDVNRPDVLSEVEAMVERYERALVTNDIEDLDSLFLNSPTTIRYGAGENLYGYDEIASFRAVRPAGDLMRTRSHSIVTTFGSDFAVAATLFTRDSAPGKLGRQSQTWVRTPDGWRVAAAHVSVINMPAD